jgi:hypothetical protein
MPKDQLEQAAADISFLLGQLDYVLERHDYVLEWEAAAAMADQWGAVHV